MSSDQLFKLRWKGVQSGPFSWAAIEQMLNEYQIGLYHEIEYNGTWMPLRDFIENSPRTSAPIAPVKRPTPSIQPPDGSGTSFAGEPARRPIRRFKLPSFRGQSHDRSDHP